jgi:uncharacterized sporulation protein YeaH/YhbH (DUF444 family)
MDAMKKYLARSFFFLLYNFVRTRYRNVDLVFVAHHTRAREVSETEFFHKGESGGTMISSGYRKALEILRDRYHSSLWNAYAFHCSDGDNFSADDDDALKTAAELCAETNLFGYGEIRPHGGYEGTGTIRTVLGRLAADNFHAVVIRRKEEVWPGLKALLSKEYQPVDEP